LGGALGAVGRWALSGWAQRFANSALPWGTLAVNLFGSLLIGALWAAFERFVVSPNLRVFLLVGLLGGFTTFSTYSLETVMLLRDGELRLALYNALAQNALGVGLALGGYLLVRAALSTGG
ncbi:MAG TPA: fluoride efflux transporter CrcB, partial [candidate division Zixibacteria bacterium]|nr:fluoride efflux transporter CrcB [candidate division Zixibacteria bacterium]